MRRPLALILLAASVNPLLADESQEPTPDIKAALEQRERWLASLAKQWKQQSGAGTRFQAMREQASHARELAAERSKLQAAELSLKRWTGDPSRLAAKKRRELNREIKDLKAKIENLTDANGDTMAVNAFTLQRELASQRLKLEAAEKSLSRLAGDRSAPASQKRRQLSHDIKTLKARIEELTSAAEKKASAETAAPQGANDVAERTDRLRADLEAWPDLDVRDLEVGTVGLLPRFPAGMLAFAKRANLERISNKLARGDELSNTERATAEGYTSLAAVRKKHNVKVVQVINEENALIELLELTDKPRPSAPLLWLSGCDLGDIDQNRSTARVDAVLRVAGTKTYETSGGADNTVFVLERFDVERLRPYLK